MKNGKISTDLSARITPSQDRAKRSVELILVTTSELLEEVGIDSFNTNLLAERAGIRVRTIYRYFPNKLAIITALYIDWKLRVVAIFPLVDPIADPRNDWRETLENLFSTFIEMSQQERGYSHLRKAVRSTPELIVIEDEVLDKIISTLMQRLTQRGVSLPQNQLRAICKLLIDSVVKFSDTVNMEGKDSAELLKKEFKVLYQSYLSNYLD
jgi:AcrR family transcriptional regulator